MAKFLFLLLAFFSIQAYATTYCISATSDGADWVACSGYPALTAATRPYPGAFKAGLVSCNSDYTQCTYSDTAITGSNSNPTLTSVAVTAATNLTNAFGQSYDYLMSTYNAALNGVTRAIKAVFRTNTLTTKEQILTKEGTVPTVSGTVAGTPVAPAGGYTYTVKYDNNFNKVGNYTITASTPAEFMQKLSLIPSQYGAYGGNIPSQFSPYNYSKITSISSSGNNVCGRVVGSIYPIWVDSAVDNGGNAPCFSVAYSNTSQTVALVVSKATCPPGYTFNGVGSSVPSSGYCTISDTALATQNAKDTTPSQVCIVTAGSFDAGDPNCQALIAAGILNVGSSPSGPAAYVQSVGGPTIASMPANSGSPSVSITTPQSGTTPAARQDITANPFGQIQGTGQTYYPTPVVPPYPGAPAGTGTTGGSGTNTSGPAATGGVTKSELVAGVKEALGDTDGKGGTSSIASANPIASKLEHLSVNALPYTSQCPASAFYLNIDVPVLGVLSLNDNGALCQAIAPWQEPIRLASIAFGFIGLSLFFLRA